MKTLTTLSLYLLLTLPSWADTSTQSSYTQVSTYPNIQPAMSPLKRGYGSNEQVKPEPAPPKDYTRTLAVGQDLDRIAFVQAQMDAQEAKRHPKPVVPVNQTVNNYNLVPTKDEVQVTGKFEEER